MSEILDQIQASFDPRDVNFDIQLGDDVMQEQDIGTDDESLYSYDYDEQQLQAQAQWEESLQQLKTLVNIVVLPLIGKILGRRFAGFVWRRVIDTFY